MKPTRTRIFTIVMTAILLVSTICVQPPVKTEAASTYYLCGITGECTVTCYKNKVVLTGKFCKAKSKWKALENDKKIRVNKTFRLSSNARFGYVMTFDNLPKKKYKAAIKGKKRVTSTMALIKISGGKVAAISMMNAGSTD